MKLIGLQHPATRVPSETQHSSLLYNRLKCKHNPTVKQTELISKYLGIPVTWTPMLQLTLQNRGFSLTFCQALTSIAWCGIVSGLLINCIQSKCTSNWTVLRVYNIWAPMLQRHISIFYPVLHLIQFIQFWNLNPKS